MKRRKNIKDVIIDESRKVFYPDGYRKVTMDDLALKLGLSKKTIYRYFSSKEELIESIFERFRINTTTRIDEALNNPETEFLDKLKALFTGVGVELSGISSPFLRDIEDHMPHLWKKINHYKNEAAFLRFSRIMDEGIRSGRIKREINKSLVIALYASAIQNLLDPRFLENLPGKIKEGLPLAPSVIFDEILGVIYKGILTEKKNPPY